MKAFFTCFTTITPLIAMNQSMLIENGSSQKWFAANVTIIRTFLGVKFTNVIVQVWTDCESSVTSFCGTFKWLNTWKMNEADEKPEHFVIKVYDENYHCGIVDVGKDGLIECILFHTNRTNMDVWLLLSCLLQHDWVWYAIQMLSNQFQRFHHIFRRNILFVEMYDWTV